MQPMGRIANFVHTLTAPPASLGTELRAAGFLIGTDESTILVGGSGDDEGYYVERSGRYVTPYLSKCLPTIYTCNRVITQAMMQAEARLTRTLPDGTTEPVVDHPVARMFTRGPNPMHTASEFMDMLASDLNLYGNAYAQIMYTRRGVAAELEPLSAGDVDVDAEDWVRGRIVYHYAGAGAANYRTIVVKAGLPPKILHIRQNATADYPYEGRSVVRYLRESIQAGLLMTEYQRRILSSGGHAQIALSSEAPIDPTEAKTIAKDWGEATRGPAAWFKTPVLPYGLKPMPLALSHADQQFLELQRFTKEELCGAFRVPPPLAADLSRSTYSNLRDLLRTFNRLTMSPLFLLWSQAISRDLLWADEDLMLTFHADERSEPSELVKQLQIGVKMGWLTPLQAGRLAGYSYDADNLPADEYRANGGGFGDDEDQNLMPDGDDPDAKPDPSKNPPDDEAEAKK